MRTLRELICPPLYRELGFDSRYLRLPEKALFEGYRRKNERLISQALLLADLVETIPYNNDYFDILVAPLADEIEKDLMAYGVVPL